MEKFNITDIEREKILQSIKRFDKPFFFYNLNQLKERLEGFSSLMDEDFKMWYACKANPLSAILKIFRNLGFGIDIASLGELSQTLNSGITNDHLLATGPAKSKVYLKTLLENGVKWIVLESTNQLTWLEECAQELDLKPYALLRTQLQWDSEEKSVLGGGQTTPFGEEIKVWKEYDYSNITNTQIKGIHIFQWGNILDINQLKNIWNEITVKCGDLALFLKIKEPILDLGGGLGIPYNANEKNLVFKEVYDELKKLKSLNTFKIIWMELGRYCVGPIGKYVCKVVDSKTVFNKKFLVLDGGVNHLARHALTGQSFPCTTLKQHKDYNINTSTYNLTGPLCTALDFFGEYELPSDIQIGDYLVFHQTGAYGFTESMPYFLCHDTPGEIIYYGDDLVTPRLPKHATDWLS